MFDVLWRIDLATLTEVSYNVGLRILERDRFPAWREWLTLRPGDIRPAAVAPATEVLEEIERRAGKPLGEIWEEEMRPYELRMHEIARERRRREPGYDPERAERLLEELRRDYGDLRRRVA
jgi:hypothetical protein